jgi:hypothetical protein
MFRLAFFSPFHYVCIHLSCCITNVVHPIMCVLYEKKQLKNYWTKKEKMYLLSSMFFLCVFFFS